MMISRGATEDTEKQPQNLSQFLALKTLAMSRDFGITTVLVRVFVPKTLPEFGRQA
jgi:hypothetical protein